MGKSRNRPGHKQKVAKRREGIIQKRKQTVRLIEDLQNEFAKLSNTPHLIQQSPLTTFTNLSAGGEEKITLR
jgi:hypothetical protein